MLKHDGEEGSISNTPSDLMKLLQLSPDEGNGTPPLICCGVLEGQVVSKLLKKERYIQIQNSNHQGQSYTYIPAPCHFEIYYSQFFYMNEGG